MGVPQFLSMVLGPAGRSVDLRYFAPGILPDDEATGTTIRRRRPLRIGVDVSSWIFKACQGFSDMLADERHLSNYGRATLHFSVHKGSPQPKDTASAPQDQQIQHYVITCTKYVIDRLHALQNSSQANILVVLDGATPPCKRSEVAERSQKRRAAQNARDQPVDPTGNEEAQLERLKGFRRAGAGPHYSTVVTQIVTALRENRIPFLVSPYESDGELAYLTSQGLLDLVVTEDSDLVAYGATPILFKVANSIGDGVPRGILLRQSDLRSTMFKSLNLEDFSTAMLAVMFVCVGSDYCGKLQGIGIVRACSIVREAFIGRKLTDQPALEVVFSLLYQHTYQKNLSDDFKRDFEASFLSALLMFRHPIVYDPIRGQCITVGDPQHQGGDPELVTYKPYAELCRNAELRKQAAGPLFDSPMATWIAEGWYSPRNLQPRPDMELPDYVRQQMTKEQEPRTAAEAATAEEEADALETQDMEMRDMEYQDLETQDMQTQDMEMQDMETQDVQSTTENHSPGKEEDSSDDGLEPGSAADNPFGNDEEKTSQGLAEEPSSFLTNGKRPAPQNAAHQAPLKKTAAISSFQAEVPIQEEVEGDDDSEDQFKTQAPAVGGLDGPDSV